MNINAEITSNRELKLHFDFPENSELNHNAWITNILIFNTRSYLEGVVVYEKSFPDENNVTEFNLTEQNINTFESIIHGDQDSGCFSTDLLNDIIIINVSIGYNPYYIASQQCCSDTPPVKTVALYYPCLIYQAAISAIGSCNCKDMCEDNLPYGFMYALLKKKAIDSCIGAMHLDMACRYYIKFFKNDSCNCTKKPCGCSQNNSQSQNLSFGTTYSGTTTKNCGCNG